VSCRQGSHGDVQVKGNSVTHQQMSHCCFGIQDPSPLPRPGRFDARSNSHTVAARSSCTKIPLAAGRAQEDETILEFGCLSQALTRFVHLDPPRLIMSR
jgi:hypothetical protein